MRTMMTALAATLLLAIAPGAWAAPPDVQVTNAWARASAGPASTGAAYVSLTAGAQADQLIGASTPVAQTAEVHESTNEGGIMRMRAVHTLDIPAGKTVTLSPGGYHIMMFNLHHPLVAGQDFPLTLTFAHSAPVTVTVAVRPIGAAAMQGHPMGGMDHGGMNHGMMGKTQ
ncbi:MAG TPA: copper chaperone PCu(A)C [Rhodopila sp.]|uniref:copper chaperone PCu(A)C n=1 Tax=Rhodopila sp. TaxID=2480087 RepID=UPI002CCA6A8E|nr:copper chaperone PCu(A)C [Rhodopila sp.]HVY14494.1 copper chaperone PCu(A)C [Rhodopila sp.]